jgi:SWI/SNF-related matrix-associated actin-dependent regulator of chromatin subfamily A member 5
MGDGTETPFVFEESPTCECPESTLLGPHLRVFFIVINGMMRGYKLQGLNWMVSPHHIGLNGILADEMVCFLPVPCFPR